MSVKSVQKGSLILTVECPTLESLERLWNDYQSGCLNDIAESYLVTDELKRKLELDHVRLRITIEEENYLICKKALMEISGELAVSIELFWETRILAYYVSWSNFPVSISVSINLMQI